MLREAELGLPLGGKSAIHASPLPHHLSGACPLHYASGPCPSLLATKAFGNMLLSEEGESGRQGTRAPRGRVVTFTGK